MSSVAAKPSVEDPLADRRHLISVDELHRMGDAGIFAPGARVELIEGVILDMTPIGSAHASRVRRLNDLLAPALQGRAIVAVQDPIPLGAQSEPQPDLVVLRYRDDFYADRHPGPEETLLNL